VLIVGPVLKAAVTRRESMRNSRRERAFIRKGCEVRWLNYNRERKRAKPADRRLQKRDTAHKRTGSEDRRPSELNFARETVAKDRISFIHPCTFL
jgi:hypothetical protein